MSLLLPQKLTWEGRPAFAAPASLALGQTGPGPPPGDLERALASLRVVERRGALAVPRVPRGCVQGETPGAGLKEG